MVAPFGLGIAKHVECDSVANVFLGGPAVDPRKNSVSLLQSLKISKISETPDLSSPGGNADIYVINAEGGLARRLTTEPSADEVPSWSHDGRWIYFRSNRSGEYQIWKAPADGGEAVQVTKKGGFAALESPDGQDLYYVKFRQPAIWKMLVKGGDETLILNGFNPQFWGYWAVRERGLYFVHEDDTGVLAIEFYDFATRRVTQLAPLDKNKWTPLALTGFTVSPDGQTILYVQQDGDESDIILVDNFR